MYIYGDQRASVRVSTMWCKEEDSRHQIDGLLVSPVSPYDSEARDPENLKSANSNQSTNFLLNSEEAKAENPPAESKTDPPKSKWREV